MSDMIGEQRADLFLPPSGQGRVVGAEGREEGRARTQPGSRTFTPAKHTLKKLSNASKHKPKKNCSDILFPLMLVSPSLWLILFFPE